MSDDDLHDYEFGRGWEYIHGGDRVDDFDDDNDDYDEVAEEKRLRGMGVDSYDAVHVGEPWTPDQAWAESLRMQVPFAPKKDDQEQLCAFYECQSHFNININNDLVYVNVDGCSKYLPEPCRCPAPVAATKECEYRFLGYGHFIRKDDVWILGSKVLYFKDEEARDEWVDGLSLNLLSCSKSPLVDFHKVEKKETMIKGAAKR